jgi:hypothetical protein
MQRTPSLVTFLLLTSLVAGTVHGAAERPTPAPPGAANEQPEQPDRDACDCCQKCSAAMKDIKETEKEPPARDGCRDCCAKCGKEKKPTEQSFPPEILEK